ncbi:MAG: MFS transporter [Acholeplasmataceae bacterium]|nr:MFS transporter [Acholeplasmataceae bacterium]
MDKVKKINVFKNRNFNLLFAGVLVSNIAHVLFSFAISLYILRIANDAYGIEKAALIQAGYLATSGIILLIFMPVGGVLADKLNKVRTMYITDYIRGFTIGLVAVSILLVDNSQTMLIILFIMNIILSINSSLFNPAGGSLLRFIVKDEELQQASAYMQGSGNLQNIIGLILGGIIFATFGIFWIFIINAVGYILSAISEMFIRYDHKIHTMGDEEISFKNVLIDMKSGMKYLFAQKAIFATIIMALCINFFFTPIFSNAIPYFIEFGLGNEPTYLWDQFLTRETWYSITSVAFSLPSILMALYLSTKKTKEKYGKQFKSAILGAVIVVSIISCVMILYYLEIINIDLTLIGLTVSLFLIGFMIMWFNVPMSLIIQRNVEPQQLGKVSSVMNVLSQALIPIGSMLAGVIISQLSIVYLFVFATAGSWIVVLAYMNNKVSNQI